MGDKLPIFGENFRIDAIYGYLENEEGLPTHLEIFSPISLATEFPIIGSQSLTLLYFCHQRCFSLLKSTYHSPPRDCFASPCILSFLL